MFFNLISHYVIISYTLGCICIIAGTLLNKAAVKKAAAFITLSGLLGHTLVLASDFINTGFKTVDTGLYIQLFSWLLLVLYFFIWHKLKSAFLGFVLAPLALTTFVLSFAKNTPVVLPDFMQGQHIVIHISTLYTSSALILIAFIASLYLLYLDKKIKHKTKFSNFDKTIPALSALDTINYYTVAIGFPLYTIGFLMGIVGAHYVWTNALLKDAKFLSSALIWFFFGFVFYQRLVNGARGKKGAYYCIYLFCLIVLLFIGVTFFSNTQHSL